MSVRYTWVQWTPLKLALDATVLALVATYLAVFQLVGSAAGGGESLSPQIFQMRAWGSAAFLLLTFVLALGPAARIFPVLLPALHNRRHFGIIVFATALWHAKQVLDYYHAWGVVGPWRSLLEHDAGPFPFQWFGLGALTLFGVLALTSHDAWQAMLGARLWKALHMLAYPAYGLAVAHLAFGGLAAGGSPGLLALALGSLVTVGGLHLVSAGREARADRPSPTLAHAGGKWLDAGPLELFEEGVPRSVRAPGGERIAVVASGGRLSAMHGVCAHQGGPLAEGRVIDGCLTCPWHGWQYRTEDGCAPPPFEERLPTHRTALSPSGRVLVEAKACPPGAAAPTTPIPPASHESSP